jgi:hypothetical protein
MRRPFLCALVVALIALPLLRAQEGEKPMANSTGSKTPSDREKAGLRGPVRSIIEERVSPSWTDAEGKVWPESKMWNKWEYDRDGRLTAFWRRNWSREGGSGRTIWVTRSTYNAAGQLLRRSTEIDARIQSEIVYSYNDKGRLASITNSKEPDNPIAFRYDANGRWSKIAVAKPIDLPEGTNAVSRSMDSLFETESTSAGSWEGGSTITLYDEQDRPTEIQAYDAGGAIASRTVRTYDEQGRVLEEKQTMDDPVKLIPAKDQGKLLQESGQAAQAVRDQLTQFLGGSEMWSVKYTYDTQGRKIQTLRNTFNHIKDVITTSYNQQGDVAKEISQNTTTGTGTPEGDGTRTGETVYFYQYDASGNWTLKKTATRELPDGVLKDSGDVVARTVEYY